MDPSAAFEVDGYIYTPLSTSGSINRRSRITVWPTFNGSTNLQHQEQQLHRCQPSKNPYIDGSIFSSSTPILSSFPQSSLISHSPFPVTYASLQLDSHNTIDVCDQDMLLFSQQQHSPFNLESSTLNKGILCDMRLANLDHPTASPSLSMSHVDPAALVLSETSRSSTPSTGGLSTPELSMSSSFTSTEATDQDILHPFLINSFSHCLSLSPTAISSALPPSTLSSSPSTLTESTPSPVNQVPAYYGLFMPDGTVYHFDGTSLVQAPMSRATTIESSLLETCPLVNGSAIIQNPDHGWLQVPPLMVDHFQGTPSSLSSSFGSDMLLQTPFSHAPSLTADYNTMLSYHPTAHLQVPTLITGLRQDISLTEPSSSSLLPSSATSLSPLSMSSSPPPVKASQLEILASLRPSAFRHSMPSPSCLPVSSASLPKQPRKSRSATAKSSKRSTRHQQQKKLDRSSISTSTSTSTFTSSSFSLFSQESTPALPARATARTTRATKPSSPRPAAKFPCPFAGCDYRYNLKRELNRHKNVHLFEDKDKYQCLHCNAGLCRLDSVKRHMEAKGKSACLAYGLYREFKPNGEVKRIRKCKDNWYAAAAAARIKGK